MGNKRKSKLSKKQNTNRLRDIASHMRATKRAKLSSSEPTLIAKMDSQTLSSPEKRRESPVYIMNIDIPSSSTSNNCGRMKTAIENITEASIEAEACAATSSQAGNITMIETKEETETIGVELPSAPPEDVECRACLQRFDYEAGLLDMFQAWEPPWHGMGESIAQDLARLANVNITTDDSYSKLICQFCHQKLLQACSFVVNVRINDRLLRQRAETLHEQDNTWPKPIQVVRIINSNVLNSSMDVEIKQEVLCDDETYPSGAEDTFKDGVDVADDTENTFNKMEIKIEPEEIMQPAPFQIMVNGRDNEAITLSTGSRGPRGKSARYYREYRARKRAEQEKESLNRTSDPSTTADSSTINVAGSVTSKKRKPAAEYQREYRARTKAKRDNILIDSLAVIPSISTGGFTTTHQSTIDQLTTAGPAINPQATAESSINPPMTAWPSTSSDIRFAKPTRRKTSAEYQREYRARKKAQRESTRAAKTNDG